MRPATALGLWLLLSKTPASSQHQTPGCGPRSSEGHRDPKVCSRNGRIRPASMRRASLSSDMWNRVPPCPSSPFHGPRRRIGVNSRYGPQRPILMSLLTYSLARSQDLMDHHRGPGTFPSLPPILTGLPSRVSLGFSLAHMQARGNHLTPFPIPRIIRLTGCMQCDRCPKPRKRKQAA